MSLKSLNWVAHSLRKEEKDRRDPNYLNCWEGFFLVFDVRDSSEIGVILGMRERLLLRGTFCVLLDLTREVEFTGVREREEAE